MILLSYELKTVEALCEQHRAQLLNYLMLCDVHHGKLINFRPLSVEWEFVSTNLTENLRKEYTVCDKYWCDTEAESSQFKSNILQVIDSLGLFLDTDLYTEIITYLKGQSDRVIQPINIISNNKAIARQKEHLLTPDTAFKISMISRNEQSFESNLHKLLLHTELRAIQWVNLNHNLVTFKTIKK